MRFYGLVSAVLNVLGEKGQRVRFQTDDSGRRCGFPGTGGEPLRQ